MTKAQTAIRESLCHRILGLTDEEVEQITNYLDELEANDCDGFQLHIDNRMRGKGRMEVTTDEIMQLTRG